MCQRVRRDVPNLLVHMPPGQRQGQQRLTLGKDVTVHATLGIGPRADHGFGLTVDLDVTRPGADYTDLQRLTAIVTVRSGVWPLSAGRDGLQFMILDRGTNRVRSVQEDMIMTRHIIDTGRTTDDSERLRRFLEIARRNGRHPAITQLLRQPRLRPAGSRRIACLLRQQRVGFAQARTNFS